MVNRNIPTHEGLFSKDRPTGSLGARTARGGAITVASQGLQFVLSVAGTLVLARLLTPADYGLVGMVSVVIGFASIFKEMGLSEATVQRHSISHQQISTLFWLNVGLGMSLMILVASIAPAVAAFYGAPQLVPITIVSAVSFPIGALAAQHAALLRRQMRFGELAKTDLVGLAVGLAITTFLAWRGAQYWALVVGRLAEGLSVTAALWLLSGWRPGLPVRHAGIRSMVFFGGNLTGFSVTNYLARNLDNLLIGRFWGAEQLGLYAKAYQLLLLPIKQLNAPLSAVSVPALSALAHDPERYRQAYLRILEKIAIITMPGMAFAMATADWLVLIVLGPRWVEVGKIFAVLAASALVQPVANTAGWLFISQDRSRDMLRWGIVGSTLIVLGIAAGLPWGAVGVAASYSATTLGLAIPLLIWFVGRRGPVRAQDLYRVTAPAFVSSMAVLGTLVGLRRLLPDVEPVIGLAASLGCTVLVACLTLTASSAGRRSLRDLALAIRLIVQRREDRTR